MQTLSALFGAASRVRAKSRSWSSGGRTVGGTRTVVPRLTWAAIGKTVQITVVEASAADSGADAAGDPGCFDRLPPAAALDADTKKALAALLTPEQLQALADVAAEGGPDLEAIRKLRAASMT